MVYTSAVKSPPQRSALLPRHGMVQLVDAPKRVMLARSPLPASSQLRTGQGRVGQSSSGSDKSRSETQATCVGAKMSLRQICCATWHGVPAASWRACAA
jgi:hypothetical protein